MPKARYMPPPPKSPTRFKGTAGGSPSPADRMQHPRQGDVVEVMPCRLRERPVLASAGHAAVDELRVRSQAGPGAETEPLHHTGAKAFDEGVGAREQAPQRSQAGGGFQVERKRVAAAVQQLMDPRDALCR
jgi:hypothetical protein